MDFEKCAVACGLGELGFSGSILTDEFGPNQRWGFILTDAELPEDPALYLGFLQNRNYFDTVSVGADEQGLTFKKRTKNTGE